MARTTGRLAVSAFPVGTASVLTVDGVLDCRTYLQLRNRIIETALDQPRAVLVDVNALHVPTPAAWRVFSSGHWHVSAWPGIPIILICARPERWRTIALSGVTRHVPVHATVEAVTISVQDDSSIPAARHKDPRRGGDWVSGLAIVASVCRAWGSTPMPSGKTVWAVRRDGKPALIRHLRYQQSVGVFGLGELAGHHHKRRI